MDTVCVNDDAQVAQQNTSLENYVENEIMEIISYIPALSYSDCEAEFTY